MEIPKVTSIQFLPRNTCGNCNEPTMTEEDMELARKLNLIHGFALLHWVCSKCRNFLAANKLASS